ncbi:TIGR03885 family FMN-dependent LLM class oxidoreductase [Streptomyces alkaliterrae]|uniref:TIGR03885 family FMN-dependent LLM class oxidoreductase n=1 Tax=Streptomyces alkaliterrae TaxID=2213162 RepID=A0A5P0Z032_9ACTN|nr:TIGR03885 family FMN-dependent LLM class oxidoreductase [Streptomyces alkaliterrae]MBB1256232.1 TIGR03885 family FMN-dependent LLM class oxidoreductase [Streptomyces alkaliterrae]MBB1260443.1 TIGR03885 family FMN-dependent LLM class oxidoreductase [Streptomyces alkaliterrae]MQS04719.1 TIGR03885 family FMN-dependent LLM class oxidoreductase [Streptomyces alkaliterrae]
MTQYGFHASHEQYPPGELLEALRAAEAAGFEAGMCSDHFAPWSSRQGESGYAWSWLGAALEATSLPLGVVTAPGQRYHPAVVAQAAATLAAMYPGRFWAALGSGQALNESITGDKWPRKESRDRRLRECVDVIRALFAGETVTHDGLVRVEAARLWTRPENPPPLLAAAVTPDTAASGAEWADGLITVNQPDDAHRRTLTAYRDAGGRGQAVLQAHLSWAPGREEAVAMAHDQWREVILGSEAGWELARPEHFEEVGRFVTPDDVLPYVHVSADLGEHADWLNGQAEAGFDRIMLHQVGGDQTAFARTFGEHVLPRLTG